MAASALAERPPLVELLPKSTAAVLWTPDYAALRKRLGQTAPGRMARDKQLAEFTGTLAEGLLDFQFPASALARERNAGGLAVDWRDLPGGSYGEVIVAAVARPGDEPAWVVLVDAHAHVGLIRTVIDAELDRAERGGGKRTVESIGSGRLAIVAGRADRRPIVSAAQRDEVCGWSDDPAILRQVLRGWDAPEKESLAASPRFRRWRERLTNRDETDLPPDAEFFADLTAWLPPGAGGPEICGGRIFIGRESNDVLAEVEFLPAPGNSLPRRMVGSDTTAEPWVPREAAMYATLHWDTSLAGRRSTGDGREPSQLNLVLAGLAADLGWELPAAVKPIVPHLNGRFSHAVWFAAAADQRYAEILAATVRRPDEVATLLSDLAKGLDPAARERSCQGRPYFEVSGRCFCLFEEHLLLASDATALERAIAAARRPEERLSEALDYKLVTSRIRRLATDRSLVGAHIVRPEEFVRHYHQLAAADKPRELLTGLAATSPLHRILLKTVQDHPLPPLADFQRLVAPGGSMLSSDGDSLRYTFFLMQRH
jgi:hypothetical protein